MNTANLQLEGLLVALAHVFAALQRKNVLSREELLHALREAESSAGNHADRGGQLREANQNAIVFPIRYLLEAMSADAHGKTYRDIVAEIGRDIDDRT